jgi:GT2 family glycosyltransferase
LQPGGTAPVSSSSEVKSLVDEPDTCRFSINLLAHENYPEIKRCLESIAKWCGGYDLEIILVENGSLDETPELLDDLAESYQDLRIIHTDHFLGEAAGRNVGLKQSRGEYVILLDGCAEIKGDVLAPLVKTLADEKVGVTGARGVVTDDLHEFRDTDAFEVDAMLGYCMAMRRTTLKEVGLMDEKFRFYRNLDLDYSMQVRDNGYLIKTTWQLPIKIYDRMDWTTMPDEEKDRQSKKNFYRLFSKWHHRWQQFEKNKRA